MAGESSASIPREVAEVLGADLELSGLFRPVDPAAFLDDARQLGLSSAAVNFPEWRLLGAETLIKGGYALQGAELTLELRLFDTVSYNFV